MGSWDAALDAAGVRGERLRADFTRQRRVVARYRFPQYAAVRLLLPRPAVPHLLAATAFMHHTDNLLDGDGSLRERSAAYERWAGQTREALATRHSDHDVLRPLLHACAARPRLARHVEAFLDGAAVELDFAGFGTEADYQRYVDAYSLPAFMLLACVLAPESEPAGYRDACRAFIDGSQRLDFVNDLADDLRTGRLTIPRDVLDRHGVTREDLTARRETPGVRELIARQLDAARTSLGAAHALAGHLPAAHRAFGRALIGMEEATADTARAKGTGLLTSSARPTIPTAVRLLVREYRKRGQ
ncbi:phytoene/squalene synthase family protein [Streptomyces sp. NPDC020607]|uniref:phytoene/squalene synthase family protein n=1 Tax=Streptomyces sp. NPDC020607 TaxID=3365082 RepID=UPI0037ACB568